MFAPQPIQFRYDDAGVLGAAALGAGRVAGWDQQHAQDMAFVNAEANRRQQAWEFAQQNQLEAQKLQMAYNMRGSTATSGMAGQSASPLTQAISMAKSSISNQVDQDVPEDQQAIIKALKADPMVHPAQLAEQVQKANESVRHKRDNKNTLEAAKENLDPSDLPELEAQADQLPANSFRVAIGQAAKKFALSKAAEADRSAKQKTMAALATDSALTDDDRNVLSTGIEDSRITNAQLQSEAQRRRAANQSAKRTETGRQISDLRRQQTGAEKEAATFQKAQANTGIDQLLNLPPDQLVQELARPKTQNGQPVLDPVTGQPQPFYDSDTVHTILQYRGLKANVTDLGLQERRLVGGQASGKQLSADDAQQLLAQAGGDKEKARALARQLGYSF